MTKIFDKIAIQAAWQAKTLMKEVEAHAYALQEQMQRRHGDEYRIEINHEAGFVLVRVENASKRRGY
ncbi:MAG: hypothetical protein EOQ28_32175 [Mesorhizobium sp.]|uniref:hypothetical protein n=1 Tax=Mesorhizobium sp. TaxID=1871066 RepID=UPI000FE99F3D|nr:hypothetical protein [Mesorhizobium sp.]RWA60733.1 MAG: hypothetical protein EOQ28_32175 [Mesorhizobium sp.]RWB93812.1 MAG: hypothetical protein EOQ57_33305 [Mesorhizobium sp.]